MKFVYSLLAMLGIAAVASGQENTTLPGQLSASDYPSIQQALDANPGRMVFLPSGDYEIDQTIVIRTDDSGLFGPGRILQTNASAAIVRIEGTRRARLSDLTLTRTEGKQDTEAEGVLVTESQDTVLENLKVLDNRSRSGTIKVHKSSGCEIRHCLVENYTRIAIDDRTGSPHWGYAFNCIDGSGIVVTESQATRIEGNRVIERHLLPTPEIKKRYQLGNFVKRSAKKGTLINPKVWEAGYVNNWHQGSAIIITSPTSSDYCHIIGNYIENAAQGIDIHADHVVVAQNIVHNAFMGMKAMHGSRHVLILGNQFSKNDLWSIGLMPGTSSHAAAPATAEDGPIEPNIDGGSIIANNIISDFGYGHAHWIWGNQGTPIRLDGGQEPDDPPLTDVILQGNIVYNTGSDQASTGPNDPMQKPRYQYAIRVTPDATNIHTSNNILAPGTEGVSNIELGP